MDLNPSAFIFIIYSSCYWVLLGQGEIGYQGAVVYHGLIPIIIEIIRQESSVDHLTAPTNRNIQRWQLCMFNIYAERSMHTTGYKVQLTIV